MKKQKQIPVYFLFSFVFLFSFLNCNNSQGEEKNNVKAKLDSFEKVINEKLNENNFKNTVAEDETEAINSEKQEKFDANTVYKLKGKPDTIVIEFDKNNRLLIPDMHPGVYAEENPTPDMYKSYDFVQKHDKIEFILSQTNGIDGDITGNELFFETTDDFKIIALNCNAFAGIFFSEDGSGGVWQEFEDTEYGKEPAEHVENKIYEVPLFEGIADIVPNDLIEKADKKTDENDLLSYNINVSKITVEIQYSLKNKNYKKLLIFKYEYGD